MATEWRTRLALFGLIAALMISLAACGDDDDPVENNEIDPDPDVCETDDDCGDDAPYCVVDRCMDEEPQACDSGDDCDGDLDYCVDGTCFDTCSSNDHCDGDTPECDLDTGMCVEEEVVGCQDDDDCGADYCHQNNCVSGDFICTLQDCGGQRGVCDPSNGADGDCVNADQCTARNDCVEGFKCIQGDCTEEEVACADCEDGEQCEFDGDTLTVECINPDIVCDGPQRECLDEDTLYVCNEAGTSQQTLECPTGCTEEDGEARCQLAEGESCQDPLFLEDGDVHNFEWTDYGNTYQPDEEFQGCIDPTDDLRTIGPDVTVALEIGPNEIGSIDLFTERDNAILYIADDCGDDDLICTDPTGENAESFGGEFVRSMWYQNDSDETKTIYFVADTSLGGLGDDPPRLEATISETICNAGEPVCDDGFLGQCSSQGTNFLTDSNLECEFGCIDPDDPSDGRCEPYDHTTCSDAIVFDGDESASFSYNILDFNAETTLDFSDCDSSSSGSDQSSTLEGRSATFVTTLDENERLNASLASNFEAGLWIGTGCNDAPDCFEAVNDESSAEFIEYIADEDDEEVYIVVQAADADTEAGSFTLDLAVDEPLCEDQDPGHRLGCQQDSLIYYCSTSDYPALYECDGECNDGFCENPQANRCIDTLELESGDTYIGNFGDFTDQLEAPSCIDDPEDEEASDIETPGPDSIFQIDSEGGELLIVALDTASEDAGFYVLEDCPVGSYDASAECQGGFVPADEEAFFLDDPGTYYLVVDSMNEDDDEDFSLYVELTEGNCVPETTRCQDGNVQLCSEQDDGEVRFADQHLCFEGCDPTDVVCEGPADTSEGNRCGSISFQGGFGVIESSGYEVSDSGRLITDFSNYTANENLAAGEAGCFDDLAEGRDVFFEVDLPPLTGLKVDVQTDIDDDVALFLNDGLAACPGLRDDVDCDQSVTFQESASLDTFSADGGTQTVGIKALSNDVDEGEIIVDFEFLGGDCDPADGNVCDGEDAIQCSDFGEEIVTTCAFGCDDGECLDRTGDSCASAFDIDADGDVDADGTITFSQSGNVADFTNNYNPFEDGQSCTGFYGDGPEVVFAFEGWAGDEVTLDFETEYDGALWLTTDCSDAAAQCVEGVDDIFGAGVESISMTLDKQATYYVMGDAVQSAATGTFDFDATIVPGDRVDDAALESDTDELSWTSHIDDDDLTDSFEITNTGEQSLEFEVTDGQEDWLDITPTEGTLGEDESATIDLTVSCDSAGDYSTTIVVDSDAPLFSTVEIDAHLECQEDGTIQLTVTGLPDNDAADLDIINSEGDNMGTFSNGDNVDLRPDDYDVVPQEVTVDDTTYGALIQEDVPIGSGTIIPVTVEYGEVD